MYLVWPEGAVTVFLPLLLGVLRLGVPEDWIVQFIQKKEAFSFIAEATIVDAIAELVENSCIYPVMNKSYKTVA